MADEQVNNGNSVADASAAALVTQGLAKGGEVAKAPADGAAAAVAPPAGGTPPAGGASQQQTTPAPEGFVSKSDVQKLIDDALNARQSQQDGLGTRERFIMQKMADLPISVQNLMPKTGDVKALASAEQTLRSELGQWFTQEMAKHGKKVRDVNGYAGGTGTGSPLEGAHVQRGGGGNTPSDLVSEGLRRSPLPHNATQYSPPDPTSRAANFGPNKVG